MIGSLDTGAPASTSRLTHCSTLCRTIKFARPYFRDWTNLAFHKGKTFLAPSRIFRKDTALYFPNLIGRTLLKSINIPCNTTPLLVGKASIVCLFSGQWAENQVQTFIGEKNNPELHNVLAQSNRRAQLVRVNIEDSSTLKWWILQVCRPALRGQVPEVDWDKYFMVKRGITNDMRESIGYLNSKVGYVYLVDSNCRIRWAGCGPAQPDEVKSLANGLVKLLEEQTD